MALLFTADCANCHPHGRAEDTPFLKRLFFQYNTSLHVALKTLSWSGEDTLQGIMRQSWKRELAAFQKLQHAHLIRLQKDSRAKTTVPLQAIMGTMAATTKLATLTGRSCSSTCLAATCTV